MNVIIHLHVASLFLALSYAHLRAWNVRLPWNEILISSSLFWGLHCIHFWADPVGFEKILWAQVVVRFDQFMVESPQNWSYDVWINASPVPQMYCNRHVLYCYYFFYWKFKSFFFLSLICYPHREASSGSHTTSCIPAGAQHVTCSCVTYAASC